MANVSFASQVYWQNGEILQALPTLEEIREKVQSSLRSLRNDHKRTLNPTPYKVSVSDELYSFIHNLWLDNQPILELSWSLSHFDRFQLSYVCDSQLMCHS